MEEKWHKIRILLMVLEPTIKYKWRRLRGSCFSRVFFFSQSLKDLEKICWTQASRIKRKSFINFPLPVTLEGVGMSVLFSLYHLLLILCSQRRAWKVQFSFVFVKSQVLTTVVWIERKFNEGKRGSAVLRPFPGKCILGVFLWSIYTHKKVFHLKAHLTRLHQCSIFWNVESHSNV